MGYDVTRCGACALKITAEDDESTRCPHCEVLYQDAGISVYTRCRRCDSEVSETAKRCPHCSTKRPDKTDHYIHWGSIFLGLLFALGLIIFSDGIKIAVEAGDGVFGIITMYLIFGQIASFSFTDRIGAAFVRWVAKRML